MLLMFIIICGILSSVYAVETKFHEHLTEQERLDYFGVDARYNVPEYVVVRPHHVSKHNEFPVYSIKALGEDYLLHLSPNHRLIAPGCMVHHHNKTNNTGHRYPCHSKGDNCHYHGTSINHNSSKAAISNCNGLEGIVTTRDHELVIKPVRKEHLSRVQRDTAMQTPHIIYKKNIGRIRQTRSCDVTGPNRYLSEKKLRREKRQVSGEKFLEMALVADKYMYNYHGDDLRRYMLTVANIAAARFVDPSLRNSIIFTIVKIQILEDDVPGLLITEDADETLTRFCEWQEQFNDEDDNSPAHYDGISLLTRLDISHLGIKSNTGLGTVGGMCTPNARCTYCEDTGLDLGLTLSHETGHTLGMVHDGNNNYCQDGKYIMSGSGGGGPDSFMWSQCSAAALEEFLSDENSYCLDDFPTGEPIKTPTELPGIIYTADQQCRLFMGPESKICLGTSLVEPFNNDECARLVCYDPHDSGQCIGSQSPRMDGTECDERKWCIKGRCVEIGTKGPQPVNGGWSEWDVDWSQCSRTCGGGVKIKSRKCNNPSPRFGGLDCVGENTKAELCNQKDCSTSQYKFKEEQCAATDGAPLFGKVHHWIPYDIIGQEECFRYCQTADNDGQIQMRTLNDDENYFDGTLCSGDFEYAAYTRCVKGYCRAFSCDGISDVDRIFDVCGVCGGQGDTCIQHNGTFRDGEKQRYVTFVTIPAGSSGIFIDNQHSGFTSMRIKVGEEILFNIEGGKNDQSGQYISSNGVKVKYTRQIRQPELIEIVGPIPFDLEAQVWKNFGSTFLSTRPDIYYEYYTPKERKQTDNFKWSAINEGCSTTCGGGQMKVKVECIDTLSDNIVDDEMCSTEDKPLTYGQMCNEQPCASNWRTGKFSDCSVTCDGGMKKRTVDCIQSINNTLTVVGADNCVGDKPTETERCNDLACPGVWMVDTWSQCSQSCGNGIKERQVKCVKNDTSRTPVADIQCDFFNKPNMTEKCLLAPCYTNITGDNCIDKVDCSRQDNVCHNYPEYARTNCLLYCGLCVKTASITETSMTETCEDKADCEAYGSKVCTDYAQWSKMNCAKFCNICNVALKAVELIEKQPTTTPARVITQQTTNCTDTSDRCQSYGKTVCKDYKEWSSIYCRDYCDFCSGKEKTISNEVKPTMSQKIIQLTTNKNVKATNTNTRVTPTSNRIGKQQVKPTSSNKIVQLTTIKNVKATNTNTHLTLTSNRFEKQQDHTADRKTTGGKITPAMMEPKCTDLIDCKSYSKKICIKYKTWSVIYCKNYCGQCPLKKVTSTQSSLTPIKTSSSKLILTDNEQIEQHASMKILFTTVTPVPYAVTKNSSNSSECFDISHDCDVYDKSICKVDRYQKWVNQYCRKFCDLCSKDYRPKMKKAHGPICKDEIKFCHAYGKGVCKKYVDWSLLNCPLYCNLCVNITDQSAPISENTNQADSSSGSTNESDATITNPSNSSSDNTNDVNSTNPSDLSSDNNNPENIVMVHLQTNKDTTTAAEVKSTNQDGCLDKADCQAYGKSVCNDYKQWSQINCRKSCNFCQNSDQNEASMICSDLIQCSGYGKSVCSKYKDWAKMNCKKYCELCNLPGFM
ncbi:hypothetical protein SNE40_001200 [Patella caerulea]